MDWSSFLISLFLPETAQAQLVAPPLQLTPQGLARASLPLAIMSIVNIFLIMVGIATSIYLIIAGVRYIGSRGDEKEAETAKNSILMAVIGLVVIGLSMAIVRFVIGAINVS